MKKLTISVDEYEYDWVKGQLKGYVRSLIQADMGAEKPVRGRKKVKMPNAHLKGMPLSKHTGSNRKMPEVFCRKCGTMKISGKCVVCA